MGGALLLPSCFFLLGHGFSAAKGGRGASTPDTNAQTIFPGQPILFIKT